MGDHIEDQVLMKLVNGTLREEEELLLYEHIGQCDFCAMRYSEIIEKHMIKAPMGMKESILNQTAPIPFKKESSKISFYSYCAKAVIGMVAGLLLLFGNTPFYQGMLMLQMRSYSQSIEFDNQMNEKMKQFETYFFMQESDRYD